MVSGGVNEEHTGIDDDDNERLILEAIHKRRRVPLQTLIRLFVEGTPRVMGESTLKRHLGRLSASKQIGKLKDGKKTIYCVPGESLPERMPPSGVDLFLVDEMKKLVSDIIASGLIFVDSAVDDYLGENRDANIEAEFDDRIRRRSELAQRGYTLFWAVRRLQEQRLYQIPIPRPYSSAEWLENDIEIAGDETDCRNHADNYNGVIFWLDYYLDAIDFLTRELSTSEGGKKPAKARKATSRCQC